MFCCCCCCCCKAEFNFSKLPLPLPLQELEIEMPFLTLFTERSSAGEDSVALDCLFLSLFFPCSKSDDSDQMRQRLCSVLVCLFFVGTTTTHSTVSIHHRRHHFRAVIFFPPLQCLFSEVELNRIESLGGHHHRQRIAHIARAYPSIYSSSLSSGGGDLLPTASRIHTEYSADLGARAVHQSIAAWQLPSGKLFAFLAFCSVFSFYWWMPPIFLCFFVSSSSDADSDLFCCRRICTDLPISEPTSILFFLFFFFFPSRLSSSIRIRRRRRTVQTFCRFLLQLLSLLRISFWRAFLLATV